MTAVAGSSFFPSLVKSTFELPENVSDFAAANFARSSVKEPRVDHVGEPFFD